MDTSRRYKKHEDIREEIKTAAWNVIARDGVTDLSLGSIAREMRLTTPALYRYFRARDDLVNTLMEDAHFSFSEALKNARSVLSPDNHPGRFRALCQAYRDWAVHFPQRYLLLFGAPIPGYRLDEKDGQSPDPLFGVFLNVLNEADQASRLTPPTGVIRLPPDLHAQYEALRIHGHSSSPRVVHLALTCWSFLHGLTSLEIHHKASPLLADKADAFFQFEIERLMLNIGFKSTQ